MNAQTAERGIADTTGTHQWLSSEPVTWSRGHRICQNRVSNCGPELLQFAMDTSLPTLRVDRRRTRVHGVDKTISVSRGLVTRGLARASEFGSSTYIYSREKKKSNVAWQYNFGGINSLTGCEG